MHVRASDFDGAFVSGAFDYNRDGPVDRNSWVGDAITHLQAPPNDLLCPSSGSRLNEKTIDYMAPAAGYPSPNIPFWGTDEPPVPHVRPGSLTTSMVVGPETEAFWRLGINTNYATTYHLVRGDSTADDGYDNDGIDKTIDGANKLPQESDGPLTLDDFDHVAPAMVGMTADGKIQDWVNAFPDAAIVAQANAFAGEVIIREGDFVMESFTDGMNIDMGVVNPAWVNRRGHTFDDMAPLHFTSDLVGNAGGVMQMAFADGHVASLRDTNGDGYVGPFLDEATDYRFTSPSAHDEIEDVLWWSRLDPTTNEFGDTVY